MKYAQEINMVFNKAKILVICSVGVMAFASTKTEEKIYSGQAQHAGNNIYTETHHEFYEGGKHTRTTTEYLNAAGKVIVTRKADYTQSSISPDYELTDLRNGHYEKADQVKPDQFKFTYKKNNNETTKEKVVDLPKGTVVESGINNFVKQNWTNLQNKKTITFNFAVTARMTYYTFNLTSQGECLVDGKKVLRVKMEPDNFVLQKMVDPILMSFELNSKRMVSYEGISNIRDDKSQTMIVKILYPELGP